MRIRTRHKLFRLIIGVAILVFLLSLFDIFVNKSAWFTPVMVVYVVLAILALILYIGYKPTLEEEAEAEPVGTSLPADEVVTEPERAELDVAGPHHYRCPFCANIFALELTHLRKEHEMRMDCPYCGNTIRVPRRPKLAPGQLVDVNRVTPEEQAVYACSTCGENLRYTSPGTSPGAYLRVRNCPHCGSANLAPAARGGTA